ncbi:MAG: hypothetical protein RLZZ46_1146, partial [Bacteroidota bacterium]
FIHQRIPFSMSGIYVEMSIKRSGMHAGIGSAAAESF